MDIDQAILVKQNGDETSSSTSEPAWEPPKARAYQIEMFEKSMRGNIIAVVCMEPQTRVRGDTKACRWILGLEKRICMINVIVVWY